MSQDTSVEVDEVEDDASESEDGDFMSTEGMPKDGRRIDYAVQISDSPETFREKAEEYKREDGSYSHNGQKLLFLADMKERGHGMSLAQLARAHDKNSSTCKGWVHTYLKLGGIEALVAPVTRSGAGGRPSSAASKVGEDQINQIMEFCDNNYVTTVEQIRDHLVENNEFGSLGVATIKTALDQANMHLAPRLYVAEGAAVKRTRKAKATDVGADGHELPPTPDEEEESGDDE